MKILVTGGAGLIASHFVEHVLRETDWKIVILDKLTYASNGFNRLREIGAYDNPRVKLYPIDLCHKMGEYLEHEIGTVDYIVHMAAETHVDNSISAPRAFVESNVLGTFEMLEYARRLPNLKRFVYFSTDEVFGPAPEGKSFKEWDRYNSTNPYSATKAAGEELSLAWSNTYGIPVSVIHCMNAFGERQHPEKFIPKVVKSLLSGDELLIHANRNLTKSSSRFYVHCRNISSATLFILDRGRHRDKYNISGEKEISNEDLAKKISGIVGKDLKYGLVDFHSSRPGHDMRYALNGNKLSDFGWNVPKSFDESLEKTIRWMVRPENLHWLDLKQSKNV